MYTCIQTPFPQSWTPQQIADAVPARLCDPDLHLVRIDADRAANQPGRRGLRGSYLRRNTAPALFRVHG